MSRWPLALAIFFPAAMALAVSGAFAASETNAAAADAGSPSPPEARAAVSQAIASAINSPDRPAGDKELDASRHPDQLLAFFGIAPGMKVADLWAGGGYTTELLARTVGPSGKVYSQNGTFSPALRRARRPGRRGSRSPV